LKWISIFQWVRKFFPKITTSRFFVEIWVLVNLIFSMACLALSSSTEIQWWELLLLLYAGIRVFEVVVYQVNVLLFNPYRAEKKGIKDELGSYRRIVICLIHNYLEILFWFALYYRNFFFSFETKTIALNTFSGSLYFSLVTMSTLGYGDITPKNLFGVVLCFGQTLVGIFMALLILGRFISLLPRPGTLDKHEK